MKYLGVLILAGFLLLSACDEITTPVQKINLKENIVIAPVEGHIGDTYPVEISPSIRNISDYNILIKSSGGISVEKLVGAEWKTVAADFGSGNYRVVERYGSLTLPFVIKDNGRFRIRFICRWEEDNVNEDTLYSNTFLIKPFLIPFREVELKYAVRDHKDRFILSSPEEAKVFYQNNEKLKSFNFTDSIIVGRCNGYRVKIDSLIVVRDTVRVTSTLFHYEANFPDAFLHTYLAAFKRPNLPIVFEYAKMKYIR